MTSSGWPLSRDIRTETLDVRGHTVHLSFSVASKGSSCSCLEKPLEVMNLKENCF